MAEPCALSPAELVAGLKATRLFSVLEPAELVALAPLFAPVRFAAGEAVARRGEVDGHLWVVIEGAVQLVEGGSTETPAGVPYAAFGDTLGAEGVFLGQPRAATAVMTRPGVLIRARRASLLAVLAQDPQLFDRLVLDDSVRSRLSLDDLPTAAGGEYRVALYRRHWIVLARAMVPPLLLLAGLMTIASLASALGAVGSERGPTVALLLVLTAVGVPAAVAVWSFFDYYHDVLIVTNRRLVHVERTPFVDAQRTEALFDRVQDVTSLTPGVGARLLGYGTVIVQTASARGSIAFDHVPRPDDVRARLVGQIDRAREQAGRERDEWVYDRLRRALGLAGPEPEPSDPDGGRAGSEPSFAGLVKAAALSALTHFWPKMRVQEGSVITWRKHWVVLARSTLVPFGLLAALLLLAVAVERSGRALPTWPLWCGAALVAGWLWWQYENWRNDLYQVTDEHVVDLERLPFGFFEERRQASLAQIQDVRYRVPNPLASLLDYGDVTIQTAAEQGGFTFDRVFRPAGVQAEIFHRIQRYQELRRREEDERRAEEMLTWLRTYHSLMSGGLASRPGPHDPNGT